VAPVSPPGTEILERAEGCPRYSDSLTGRQSWRSSGVLQCCSDPAGRGCLSAIVRVRGDEIDLRAVPYLPDNNAASLNRSPGRLEGNPGDLRQVDSGAHLGQVQAACPELCSKRT
jgi:hypothetical protein